MDFFGGAGGYSFDTGGTSSAGGGRNTGGGFSVGAFNAGGDNKTLLIAGAGVAALLLVLVLKK